MNEGIATIDGTDHSLGECFLVVATQNPIEHQGTYPLPEAQLDRFLFKIVIDFPDGGCRGDDPHPQCGAAAGVQRQDR